MIYWLPLSASFDVWTSILTSVYIYIYMYMYVMCVCVCSLLCFWILWTNFGLRIALNSAVDVVLRWWPCAISVFLHQGLADCGCEPKEYTDPTYDLSAAGHRLFHPDSTHCGFLRLLGEFSQHVARCLIRQRVAASFRDWLHPVQRDGRALRADWRVISKLRRVGDPRHGRYTISTHMGISAGARGGMDHHSFLASNPPTESHEAGRLHMVDTYIPACNSHHIPRGSGLAHPSSSSFCRSFPHHRVVACLLAALDMCHTWWEMDNDRSGRRSYRGFLRWGGSITILLLSRIGEKDDFHKALN